MYFLYFSCDSVGAFLTPASLSHTFPVLPGLPGSAHSSAKRWRTGKARERGKNLKNQHEGSKKVLLHSFLMFLWCQAQTLTLLLPSSISEPSATPQCLWLTLTFSFVSSTAISTQFDYFIDIFSGQIPPTNPTAKCLDGSTANFSRFANT